jgi:multidrug efflux pump subunit AcrA (membrane-fusion protein)
VVERDGTVRFQPVTIGRDDGDKVELSSGVTDGERLVLNISNQIVAGEKVRVSGGGPPGSSAALRDP